MTAHFPPLDRQMLIKASAGRSEPAVRSAWKIKPEAGCFWTLPIIIKALSFTTVLGCRDLRQPCFLGKLSAEIYLRYLCTSSNVNTMSCPDCHSCQESYQQLSDFNLIKWFYIRFGYSLNKFSYCWRNYMGIIWNYMELYGAKGTELLKSHDHCMLSRMFLPSRTKASS